MPDATFTFRLDDRLKTDFAEVAKAQDRTTAQLLRVLMRTEVNRQREMPSMTPGSARRSSYRSRKPTIRT